ncbi:armadillo-type protein [Auriculariales sp. MPI-PUGE-AT-0066]|nr:armadillo-type protein [Auriculariales sp. MPI-PUGE-AT-0066]
MFKSFKRTPSEPALGDDIFAPRPLHAAKEKENRPMKGATVAASTGSRKPIPAKLAPKFGKEREDMLARRDTMLEAVATNRAFERMLDDLQIPPTLRPKLETLESPVKAAMVRSNQFLTLTSSSQATTILRRTRSTDSLDSPRKSISGASDEPSSPFVGVSMTHSRTVSVSVPGSPTKFGRQPKEKEKATRDKGKPITPEQFAIFLKQTSSLTIDVELVKKLRLYLRNEAAGWTEAFLASDGYAGLDARLMELLSVEWREEQHDDKCLHEILRCFKALSTSAAGCQTLRDHCPHPFSPLIALLYSDKKPGELSTRQLMVELLLILFELYPSAPPGPRGPISSLRPKVVPAAAPALPVPHATLFSLIRVVLLTERPGPAEQPHIPLQPHDFIEQLHLPRIYKAYLQELSDVCRDYFWVFCHPNNTVWVLSQVDEAKVERPKAPGGMTGGVEYEAMMYLTTHFRFVNACAGAALDQRVPPDHPHSAFKFHHDLQLSGMERIIATARKASTAYYGTLHLEMSRYVSLAARAGFVFTPGFMALLGMPPTGMLKTSDPHAPVTPSRLRTVPGAPKLPTLIKGEAIVL